MTAFYNKNENGVITAIHYAGSMGDNTGIKIINPSLDYYPIGPSKHWIEISEGVIREATEAEEITLSAPPPSAVPSKKVYSDLLDYYGVAGVLEKLEPNLSPFMEAVLRQESLSGHALFKLKVMENTNLSDADKKIICNIVDGKDPNAQ